MRWGISTVAATYLPALAGRKIVEVEEEGERFLLVDEERVELLGDARNRDSKARQVVEALRKFAAKTTAKP